MASITSTSFDTRSLSSGSITISHPDLTNSGSESFSLLDLGTISIEYDLEDDNDNASNIFFNLGEFTFKAEDRMSGGTSLFDRIDTDLLSTDTISITLDITIDADASQSGSSRTISESFIVNKKDLEYNYISRSVTFECKDEANYNTTVGQLFDSNATDIEDYYDVARDITEDCMSAYDYINNTLTIFNSNNSVIQKSFAFPDDQKGIGDEAWVVWSDEDLTDDVTPATVMLYKLAAFDGSIVGSIMGYTYFINRLNNDGITLSESDVEDVSIGSGLNSYFVIKSVFEGQNIDGTWSSTYSLLGSDDGFNEDAEKRLDAYFEMQVDPTKYPNLTRLSTADWDSTNTRYNSVDQGRRVGSSGVVSQKAYEGDVSIDIDDGSGGSATVDLSDGDLVYFVFDPSRTYEVDNMSGLSLTLKEPIIKDINENELIRKWTETETRNSVAQNACNCYAAAYGADGANMVELTVFGIDTVRPYQAITFDSSFKDPIANKTYRPSNIEYDFKSDKTIIEAYQIA